MRMPCFDVRIALALRDEEKQLSQDVIEEKEVCGTYAKNRARWERRAACVAKKLERMRKEEQNHRCRVLLDRQQLELRNALCRVGFSPGERTFTDDWSFWHGFDSETEGHTCVKSGHLSVDERIRWYACWHGCWHACLHGCWHERWHGCWQKSWHACWHECLKER